MKYNLLQILFWMSSCSVIGFITIFLQYKGLSNTQIGIVTGVASISSIALSPYLSSLIEKIKGLTIKKLFTIVYGYMFIAFLVLILFNLPALLVMILYTTLYCLSISIVPLLSSICTNYLKEGKYINFGVSRGMGSVSYAISAVILGQLVNYLNPTILGCVFIIVGILLISLLLSMPDFMASNNTNEKKESVSIITIIKNYRTFFLVLLAFSFTFGAASSLAVYLINIVTSLGGDTSLYGIAVFAMAASEMPFMSITHTLLKKFKSETLLLAAILFYICRNFTICLAPNLPILIIGMMFQGCSYGIFTATITMYVNDYLKPEHQMMGQSMIAMMSTGLGSFMGNVVGGILQDTIGLTGMYVYACSLTTIGVIIGVLTLRKKVGLRKSETSLA